MNSFIKRYVLWCETSVCVRKQCNGLSKISGKLLCVCGLLLMLYVYYLILLILWPHYLWACLCLTNYSLYILVFVLARVTRRYEASLSFFHINRTYFAYDLPIPTLVSVWYNKFVSGLMYANQESVHLISLFFTLGQNTDFYWHKFQIGRMEQPFKTIMYAYSRSSPHLDTPKHQKWQ